MRNGCCSSGGSGFGTGRLIAVRAQKPLQSTNQKRNVPATASNTGGAGRVPSTTTGSDPPSPSPPASSCIGGVGEGLAGGGLGSGGIGGLGGGGNGNGDFGDGGGWSGVPAGTAGGGFGGGVDGGGVNGGLLGGVLGGASGGADGGVLGGIDGGVLGGADGGVLGGVLGGIFVGWMASKAHVLRVGAVGMLSSVALMAVFGSLSSAITPMLIVTFAVGFFLAGSMISLYAALPDMYPVQIRNTATGWALGIGRLGAVLGPNVAGVLIEAGWGRLALYAGMSVPMFLAAYAAVLLVRGFSAPTRV